jgi:cytochrome c oxidase subunit 2
MVVPAGEPIHILLTSVDVNHAFYVPAFLFKRDAIPGHPNEFDVTITEPGDYNGQCAEFCGVFHDRMLLTVRAVSRPDFDAWLAARQSAPPSAAAPSAPASPAPAAASPAAS